eukprot:4418956-Amphidinium_carterae.1
MNATSYQDTSTGRLIAPSSDPKVASVQYAHKLLHTVKAICPYRYTALELQGSQCPRGRNHVIRAYARTSTVKSSNP